MATSSERKALLFFGLVITLGAGARVAHIRSSRSSADAPAKEALKVQLAAAESARHASFGKHRGRRPPMKAKPVNRKVDLDVAPEPEIEALKGIGPSLAR